jgi:hypothetical protein
VRITLTWLRLELRRRWRSLVVLALLVALATGTVLTAAAGARRGQTAFDRLWAQTLPATATVLPNQPGFEWTKIRALPDVTALSEFPVVFGFSLPCCPGAATGFPLVDDQLTRTIERPVLLAGRLFNPHHADEVVVTPQFAADFGKGVGTTLTLHLASVQQTNHGYDGSTGPPRGPVIRVRVVGVGRSLWGSVNVEGPGQKGSLLTTPALFTRYRANFVGTNGRAYFNALVRLKGGAAAIPGFRADLARVTGRSDIDVWNNIADFGGPVRRTTGYEAACLLAFALAALVAAIFLIGQSIARYTSAAVSDLQVLQAVGMTPQQAVASAAAPPFLAAAAGATLGVAAATVASRWMPIGAAQFAEPHPGVDVNWLILGPGWVLAPALVLAGSAAGRGHQRGGASAGQGRGGHQGRADVHLHAPAPATAGPGGQGRGGAAASAERIPGAVGAGGRRARTVHRRAPPPPRAGRAAGAGVDPVPVAAGDSHAGDRARRDRAGVRCPAGGGARPRAVAGCGRYDAARLPSPARRVGAGAGRPAGPAGRQPAGRLAGGAGGPAAHRASAAHGVTPPGQSPIRRTRGRLDIYQPRSARQRSSR